MGRQRRLEYDSTFDRDLQSLAKKDREGHKQVQQALERRRVRGPDPRDHLLRNFRGLPVFKTRVQAQGRGKSGGARVVYYCDNERLLALQVYLKSKHTNEDLPLIVAALQAHDLWLPN